MKKFLLVILAFIMTFSVAACGGEDGDVVTLNFIGWGDNIEVAVFNELVNDFNEIHKGEIKVEYSQIPSGDYSSTVSNQLKGRRTPDVVYVGDGDVKNWVSQDLLAPVDEYVADSEVIDFEDMWASSISRYRYDKATQRSLPTSPLYGLPKDIGPTVIYYNVDVFKQAGVTIVSKYLDDPAIQENEKQGYNKTDKIFNNKIAMTWEECEDLATMLTRSKNASSPTTFGYYTNWWFNYGWSIGGDVIKFDEAQNKYIFSLGDTTVTDAGISMYDAFQYFVDLSITKKISPLTNAVGSQGTTHKTNYFLNGHVAMYVDMRSVVPELRNKATFDWDVAPLPRHKNGVEAGHSGSMALGIAANSKKKQSAYKFIEYIAGPVGQEKQAETGFNIPNQRSSAYTEVFLQSDKKPKNSVIFCDAAEIQGPGDWNYLADSAWIDVWAPTLNNRVLNNEMGLTEFFNAVKDDTNIVLAKYTA